MINMKDSGFGDIYSMFSMPRPAMAGAGGQPTTGKTSVTKSPDDEDPQMSTGATTEGGTVPAQQQQPAYTDYNNLFAGAPAQQQGTGIQGQGYADAAAQLYQNAATNPWFEQAAGMFGQMAQNGMPTSSSDWYQNAKAQAGTDVMDIIKQINEQASSRSFGKRYSNATARAGMDQASRRFGEMGTQFAGMEMGAQEAARNRQLQAMGGLGNLASAYGQNQMGAGQGYQSLQNDQNAYGMNLANQAYGMGQGLYGVSQNQANDLGNYWQGNQWWSNPALQMAMQQSQYSPDYAYPQYKQSTAGQILNIFSSLFG
jgi:hypothetical protein